MQGNPSQSAGVRSNQDGLPEGSTFRLVLGLFFLSGAAGLVYEVVWTRYLTLAFGVTAEAVSAVLAAYMGGLALGSFLLGRRTARIRNLLRTYAWLELGVGIFALLTPLIYLRVEAINIFLFRNLGETGAAFDVLRFVVSFAVMLIPTTMMGGTLPILSRFVVSRRSAIGFGVGTLYSINTFGAVLGTFAAGYFLIPVVGLSATVYVAAAFNLAVGAGCYVLSKRPRFTVSGEEEPEAVEPEVTPVVETPRRLQVGVIVGLGVSGFVALLYEVVWTRILQLVLGTSAYAFACMLTTFLFGIALGSLIVSRFVDRVRDPARLFGYIQLAVGFCALAIIPLFGQLPFIFLKMFALTNREWGQTSVVEFASAFLVMLIPTMLFGASFPVAARVVSGSVRRLGRAIGNIYAVNTVGSILGSLMAGFVIIPLLGTQRSEFVGAGLSIALGSTILLLNGRIRAWRRLVSVGVAAAVFVGCLLYLPRWDMKVLLWGVYHKAAQFMPVGRDPSAPEDIAQQLEQGKLIYYREGIGTTAAVFEEFGRRSIVINGKLEASTVRMDMRLQRMMGHLPLLLHPNPKRAINVGLGAGVTFGAVMQHPLDEGRCAELSKSIMGATRRFGAANHYVMENPKAHIILRDGRNYLRATLDKFDCITADPFHPYTRGAGSLYTVEYFEAARAALNPGGVMCQFLPLYNLSDSDFKMIVQTFRRVFPAVSVWFTDVDMVMLGTEEPMRVDYAALKKRMEYEPVRKSLEEVGFETVDDVLARFILDEKSLDLYCGDAPINTENHPILEYSSPKSAFVGTIESNLAEALQYRTYERLPVYHFSDNPEEAAAIEDNLRRRFEAMRYSMDGQVLISEGKFDKAVPVLRKSVEMYPDDMTVREHLNRCYVLLARWYHRRGDTEMVRQLSQTAIDVYPEAAAARVNLGNYYFQSEDYEKALDLYRGAVPYARRNGIGGIHEKVAETLVRLERMDESIPEFRLAIEEKPESAWIRTNLGSILMRRGRWVEASEEFREAIRLDPDHANAYVNLGATLLNEGKVESAISYFRLAAEKDPENAEAHANLGITLYRQGKLDEARREIEIAVRLAPGRTQLRQVLEQMNAATHRGQ
ncbi:MAG: fused MFS/spermidine synthase [Candidatus Eisenbacteria sp.]|nr:fused MFS/spermidine synthase [Candidatus Eisenbacteria bacterium]